jgi:predicted house-cleaning NTP pyrophosphatase (Maf/HAM1 superfamily)
MWIIDNQLGRRNLSPFARFELMEIKEPLLKKAAKANSLANLKQNAKNIDVQKSSPRSKTRDIIEKETGMSHDTYRKAKKVKEKASPEMLKQLRNGTKKINTAHRELITQEQKPHPVPEQETKKDHVFNMFKLEFKLTICTEDCDEPYVMIHNTCIDGKDRFEDISVKEVQRVIRAIMFAELRLLAWHGYDGYDDYYDHQSHESSQILQ